LISHTVDQFTQLIGGPELALDELPHHAGWYADPESSSGERWWNGSQWTSHTRPDATLSGSAGMDGLPPTAWSEAEWPATETPPAEVSPWTPPTTAFAVDGPVQSALPPAPLGIAPGWYPDPNGLPAQRWWDGTTWTEHSAPFVTAFPPPPPPGRYTGSGYSAPYGTTNIVVMGPRKSVGVAFVLTWFFGPLGMLYSTVSGALIMLAASVIGSIFIGIVTFGLGLIVLWPLLWVTSIIWGCVAAANQRGPSVTHIYR
jgi:hypothetical protein